MRPSSSLATLVAANRNLLRQGREFLETLDPSLYVQVAVPPHRAGGHMRHILEFYACFLRGCEVGRVDYDSRRRDPDLESHPAAASRRACEIAQALEPIRADAPLLVRPEDCDAPDWMRSSICRELQVLRSHTVHHYALMSLTLQTLGVAMDPDFGMAPSTLRFRESLCAR